MSPLPAAGTAVPKSEGRSLLVQLERLVGLPAAFLLVSTTVALASGFSIGGVTAVMTNIIETPKAVPHILRTTRLVGLAGLVHGIVGAGLIATWGADGLATRAISGCAAGASLGIAQGRPGLACGLCLALGGLSVLEKTTQEMATRGPLAAAASPAVSPFSPTYKRREIWFEELKERLGRE